MYRRSALLVLASTLVAAGCNDSRNPAAPPTEVPSARISDGRSGGNDDFFFLPPVMPDPKGSANYDAGAFNAKLGPTVQVCQLAANPLTTPGTDCAVDPVTHQPLPLVASFTSSQVQVGAEDYHVNWKTDDSNLNVNNFYRLQVILGATRLGFADIDPISNGRELKNANTNEIIPLVDGRTLPVKFRIEKGALCANKADCGEFRVTQAGGTFVTNTGYAGIQFPDGFLPAGVSEITLKIERIVVGASNNCHVGASARLWKQFEGCYEMTSDPDLRPFGGIQKVSVAAQCTELPASDPLYNYQEPYKSHQLPNGGVELLELHGALASFINCRGFTGSPAQIGQSTNPLIHLAAAGLRQLGAGLGKVFGVRELNAIDLGLGEELGVGSALSRFSWAIGLEAETSGDDQDVGFGLQAEQPLGVHIKSLHSHAPAGGDDVDQHPENVAGVDVVFTVTDGDGYFELGANQAPVRTKHVLTAANGIASVNFIADPNDATNVVKVESPTLDEPSSHATISVNGLPPDLVVQNLQRSPAAPTTTDELTWSFVVKNVGRGAAVPSVVQAVVAFEGEGTETIKTYPLDVPRLLPGETFALSTPALAGPHDAGDYSLTVVANATALVTESDDENNGASEDFVITAPAPTVGTLSGGVADASDDSPIVGASLTLITPAGQPRGTVTGDAGAYTFGTVQPGTYTLTASMEGYQPLTKIVNVTGGQIFANFALVPAPDVPELDITNDARTAVTMMTGATLQLLFSSNVSVQWVTSDGTKATVSPEGLVTVVAGNENPAVENAVTISAIDCVSPQSQAVLNSWSTPGAAPTTFVWKPVDGALDYRLIVEKSNCLATVPSQCTSWADPVTTTTRELSYAMPLSGAYPTRWKVQALDPAGRVISTSSLVYTGGQGG